MMVKFRDGAIIEQLSLMGSGTGRMRDATGLSSAEIQRAIKADGAPDDIAGIIVGYLGKGILDSGEPAPVIDVGEPVEGGNAEEELADAPDDDIDVEQAEDIQEIDISLTVDEIVENVESGLWPASAVLELETAKDRPRSTLVSRLEELT